MGFDLRTNEAGDYVIRLAKVVAVKLSDESDRWIIYFEGGISLSTPDSALADRAIDFLAASNSSDENFFSRAG